MRGIITFLTSKRYLLVWYHGNDVASLLKTDHLKSCIGSDLVNVNKKDMKIYPSLTPKQKDMVTFFSAIPPDWANSLVNYRKHQEIKLNIQGTSLVAQWLRIRLPGFPGGAVVESPPAGAGDAGSGPGLGGSRVPWSGWAREPRLLGCASGACAPRREGARWWEARAPRWRVAPACRGWGDPSCGGEDPTQPKINRLIN